MENVSYNHNESWPAKHFLSNSVHYSFKPQKCANFSKESNKRGGLARLCWLGTAHEVTFLTWKMSLDITMKVGLLNKFLSNGGH